MLEQFKIPEEELLRVPAETLRTLVGKIFQKMGVSVEDGALAADALVTADLRGVDSHGVSNMLRRYVAGYKSGDLNPQPSFRVVRETLATANLDCDRGLGIIMAPKAMELAVDKAKATGVGLVTATNGRHLGMAAYHAMLALKHDMIGVCMTNASPKVLPTFGREQRLGTNPIAVAVPAGKEPPFVFDAATSVIAANKMGLLQRLDSQLPGGWLADSEGNPLMENGPVPDSYSLLPLGSTRELSSHKGYGLACVVDILTGILSGGGYGMMILPGHHSHLLAAYNVEAFTSLGEFKQMMDDYLRLLKSTLPAPGMDRVLVPGQPEWEMAIERRTHGIPLHREVVAWFRDTCQELDVALPF